MAASDWSTSEGSGVPDKPIKIEEQYKWRPAGALVAVDERVVPRQATSKHCGLDENVRVEVLAPKTAAGACRAESASSTRLALANVGALVPVTYSASQTYSARLDPRRSAWSPRQNQLFRRWSILGDLFVFAERHLLAGRVLKQAQLGCSKGGWSRTAYVHYSGHH